MCRISCVRDLYILSQTKVADSVLHSPFHIKCPSTLLATLDWSPVNSSLNLVIVWAQHRHSTSAPLDPCSWPLHTIVVYVCLGQRSTSHSESTIRLITTKYIPILKVQRDGSVLTLVAKKDHKRLNKSVRAVARSSKVKLAANSPHLQPEAVLPLFSTSFLSLASSSSLASFKRSEAERCQWWVRSPSPTCQTVVVTLPF